jgi:cytoskeletal protein RodZ
MELNSSIGELGVGALLKRAREEKGIPLSEVANATRVRSFFLEKIESEEFERLPGVPYERGFIRAYAAYIGVDDEEVVRHYNNKFGCGTEDIDKDLEAKIGFSLSPSSRKRIGSLLPIAVAVLFILASGTFLWFLRGKTEQISNLGGFADRIKAFTAPTLEAFKKGIGSQSGKTLSGPSPGDTGKTRLRGEGASFPGSSGNGGDTGKSLMLNDKNPLRGRPGSLLELSSAEGSPGGRSALNGGRLSLTIKAVEDTWFRLQVDESDTVELLLTEGNEKTWRGSDKFILTVGNVAGTKVVLNGRPIPLPQPGTNILREFVITDKMFGLQQASSGGQSE